MRVGPGRIRAPAARSPARHRAPGGDLHTHAIAVILLRDSTVIDAAPERVWAWLGDLPTHYRAWHPAHVACRYDRGDSLAAGTIMYVEEQLHGRRHRLRLRATEVVPGRLMRYQSRGFRGAFLVEPWNGATRFTADLEFGIRVPVLGAAVDAVLRRVLARRLAAFRTHMREEGENLKRLLERDLPSGAGA